MSANKLFKTGDDAARHIDALDDRATKLGQKTDEEKLSLFERSLATGVVRTRYNRWKREEEARLKLAAQAAPATTPGGTAAAPAQTEITYKDACKWLTSTFESKTYTARHIQGCVDASISEKWSLDKYRERFAKIADKLASDEMTGPALTKQFLNGLPILIQTSLKGKKEVFDPIRKKYVGQYEDVLEMTYSGIHDGDQEEPSNNSPKLSELQVLDLMGALTRTKGGKGKGAATKEKKVEKKESGSDMDSEIEKLRKQVNALVLSMQQQQQQSISAAAGGADATTTEESPSSMEVSEKEVRVMGKPRAAEKATKVGEEKPKPREEPRIKIGPAYRYKSPIQERSKEPTAEIIKAIQETKVEVKLASLLAMPAITREMKRLLTLKRVIDVGIVEDGEEGSDESGDGERMVREFRRGNGRGGDVDV
ncbi:hypothetical protein HDU97_002448 [Phlyctochytrium planicorne]|nr:hypothetical protein HDU97_002448 [Phlyctochytrium planicorne]